jgi:hypothetical protein
MVEAQIWDIARTNVGDDHPENNYARKTYMLDVGGHVSCKKLLGD